MKMEELFDKKVLIMTIENLVKEMDYLLADNLPEGKEVKDFTGGYVQQLKNSTKIVAYF